VSVEKSIAAYRVCLIAAACLWIASPIAAQGVAFGAMADQGDAPVEVTADNLAVNQSDGTATFTGHVVIAQGDMRLAAPKVLVIYAEASERIERLEASGGVTLVSGEDAAEARNARYDIDAQVIVMEGDVLLTQGPSVMSSERMTVDLEKGTAQMGGRVRTILKQGK